MKRKAGAGRRLTFCFVVLLAASSVAGEAHPQSLHATQQAAEKSGVAQEKKAEERFAERAESLVSAAPVNKGEWGLLVVDAATGETLYEKDADKYFTPASNMKLLTTALALDKLGPDYRFRTTVETHGTIAQGVLSGDLILVGRGDPNLSNRKFPFDVKEEFDGPPEKVLIALADQIVARGVKEISGDIVGDDSYFPRDRYPDGWEIDDMVWEYGAAISAIVLDDNTVTLTLTPGEKAGDRVMGVVEPATPDFAIRNEVTTSNKAEKADLTLVREPGSTMVVLSGTLPANSAPRKLVLAIQEPAQHAASTLARLLAERGVKFWGTHSGEPRARPGGSLAYGAGGACVAAVGGHAEAGEQNQPKSAHRDIVAHGGTAAGALGQVGRSAEIPRGVLCQGRDCAGGCGAGGWVRNVAARLGDAAGRGGIAAVRANAILVSRLLRLVAGGGNRWDAQRPDEEGWDDGKDSREDRVGRACANALRLCRYTGREAPDFFVHEQQPECEES